MTVRRPWILAETTWKTVAATAYEVAVLPWGATEAHNLHLPYGTDTIQSEAIAAEADPQDLYGNGAGPDGDRRSDG